METGQRPGRNLQQNQTLRRSSGDEIPRSQSRTRETLGSHLFQGPRSFDHISWPEVWVRWFYTLPNYSSCGDIMKDNRKVFQVQGAVSRFVLSNKQIQDSFPFFVLHLDRCPHVFAYVSQPLYKIYFIHTSQLYLPFFFFFLPRSSKSTEKVFLVLHWAKIRTRSSLSTGRWVESAAELRRPSLTACLLTATRSSESFQDGVPNTVCHRTRIDASSSKSSSRTPLWLKPRLPPPPPSTGKPPSKHHKYFTPELGLDYLALSYTSPSKHLILIVGNTAQEFTVSMKHERYLKRPTIT